MGKRKKPTVETGTRKKRAATVQVKSEPLEDPLLPIHNQAQLQQLKGPENLTQYKLCLKKLADLQVRRASDQVSMKARLEPLPKAKVNETPSIPIRNRLHPVRPTTVNLFSEMNEFQIKQYQLARAHEKQKALTFGDNSFKPRPNPVDACVKCGLDLFVDKELAISVCPGCGKSRKFASHIFEHKQNEKDDGPPKQHQSVNHMQKFLSQYEQGTLQTPKATLEKVVNAYSKIHSHNPDKVTPCKTTQVLKSLTSIPRAFRRTYRLSSELKADPIPQFSLRERNAILAERMRFDEAEQDGGFTVTTNTPTTEVGPVMPPSSEESNRKSYSNQPLLRVIGRSLGMEQTRLLAQSKTAETHKLRARKMESVYRESRQKQTSRAAPELHLYPNS